MNNLRSAFLDKVKDYAQLIIIIKSTEGKDFGFYVHDYWENNQK